MNNTFKRAKVVMLPTEKASPLMIGSDTNRNVLSFAKNYGFDLFDHNKNFAHTNKQHLYIISDDEIKKGDYVYNSISKEVTQIISKYKILCDTEKKIIATTDPTLINKIYSHESQDLMKISVYKHIKLPQPSQSFIEKYVELYNSSPINEFELDVLVEYGEGKLYYDANMLANGEGATNTIFETKVPKVNPKDNTITIKKVKDTWTREDMHIAFCAGAGYDIKSLPKGAEYYRFTEWIQDNL